MPPAIRVENLSKQYRIGVRSRRAHDSLSELITGTATGLWNTLRGRGPAAVPTVSNGHARAESDGTFWALRDVSFEVQPGEVVGIIGRNGAGKSTLLKILSRITEPTSGQVTLEGRVASLLEVGTGFHPDLSGRENIHLNGSLLGMSRREVSRRFDEIVAFAGIEEFLETPVKRYSSGMYVRLAFGVAAHLRTEILLVDEVLAVGDIAFQKKCLGEMDRIASGGRTIVFVSHQMNQIRRLCSHCVWINEGRVKALGRAAQVIRDYELSMINDKNTVQRNEFDLPQRTCFLGWKILDSTSDNNHELTNPLACRFEFKLSVSRPIRHGHTGIALWSNEGQLMWGWAADNLAFEKGIHNLIFSLPAIPLCPGVYRWQVTIFEDRDLLDDWNCVPEFVLSTEPLAHARDEWSGILNLPCTLMVHKI